MKKSEYILDNSKVPLPDPSDYHVYFLFVLMADSLEQLNRRTDAFRNLAKENRITLSCCYSLQAESYLTGMPLMYRYSASVGPIKTAGLKRHTMDKLSLASIFIQADFPVPVIPANTIL